MQEILLNTFNGEQTKVTVVRYFETNGKRYLVYTLNEKDADNYLRLYVGKVTIQNGLASVDIIADEDEWTMVKGLFKAIIAANRDNQPLPIQDLNSAELTNGILNSYRVFKLLADMATILGENQEDDASQITLYSEPTPVVSMNNPVNEIPSYEMPVVPEPAVSEPSPIPTVPSYEPTLTPVEEPAYVTSDYEMPVPTPEVRDFIPETPVMESVMERPIVEQEAYEPTAYNQETHENVDIMQELEDAKERIEELIFENAELRSKIETIKLLVK